MKLDDELRMEGNGCKILLLDVWVLLYSRHRVRHLIPSKRLVRFAFLMVAAGVVFAGIFKQKQIPFLLLGADSENGDISTQINTEDNAYVQNAERGLWNLYMEMRRLDAKYHKLQKKLEILEQSSESSLQPQQKDEKSGRLFEMSEISIRRLIEDLIAKYEADRLGMADYALESSGGSIVGTPETEDYKGWTWYTLWGINLIRVEWNNPRNIIQGPLQPGTCWAFYGSNGKVIVQLSAAIHITSVALEHISPKLSTTGNIDSAPKDFAVFVSMPGLESSSANEVFLGSFSYDKNGPSRQIFDIDRKELGEAFNAVVLHILSNHGHPEYTCVYRFRVHGEI
ncbi:hypothetical protein C0J52_03188 [Blattella germanica]|nr:hypothetical protein C0J52_03188 [Blattella germanica]